MIRVGFYVYRGEQLVSKHSDPLEAAHAAVDCFDQFVPVDPGQTSLTARVYFEDGSEKSLAFELTGHFPPPVN